MTLITLDPDTRHLAANGRPTGQDIKANYEDGILEVGIPMIASKAKQERIPIGRGS